MQSLLAAVRMGLRELRASPGVTLSSVVTLALGIGFTTTMFGIVHGATRSLPFERPEDLQAVEKAPDGPADAAGLSIRTSDLETWSAAGRSIHGLAGYQQDRVNLSGDTREPERVPATYVTPNAFSLLGVGPQVGRTLLPGGNAPGAPAVVVISDRLWTTRFDRDPGITSRTLRLNGVPHAIVGVMPPRFGFPVNSSVWLPLAVPPDASPGSGPRISVFARLRAGAKAGDAETELTLLTRGQFASHGSTASSRVHLFPFTEIETPRDVIRALYVMVVAVSFVLLIACSNVANLLLARAAVRRRDLAVRMALGASGRHIVSAQLVEALMLSGVASVLGLGLAMAGTRLFAVNTANIIEAFWVDIRVDPIVVAFASLLAILASVVAGVAPALRAAGTNLSDTLAGTGRSSLRLGRVARNLVAVQVTLAGGLLALTVILAQSSVQLRAVAWPFDPHAILSAELGMTGDTLDDPAARSRTVDEIAAAVRSVPGIEAAALVSVLPGRGGGNWTFTLDAPSERAYDGATAVAGVTPSFLEVLGARMTRGRALAASDDAGAPAVAVVNQSFASRYSPGRDAIGRRIFLGTRSLRIVGVVPDLMAGDIQDLSQDGVYVPIAQFRPFSVRLIARGSAPPRALFADVRSAIRRVDPDLPVTELLTLYDAAFEDKSVLDVLSLLFLVFGAVALALTAVGLYSVLSFGVAARTREIGIRVALGATRRHVVGLVARQGSTQVAIGLAGAMALAIAMSRAFASAVERLHPVSVSLVLTIVGALALISVLSLVMPARRAGRIEVARSLRAE